MKTNRVAVEHLTINPTTEAKRRGPLARIIFYASPKQVMRILSAAAMCLMMLTLPQSVRAESTNRYVMVAQKIVDLLNAGDYGSVQKLFTPEMSQALPPQKATAFFAGMKAQLGNIEKLDKPKRNGDWAVFPVHFERRVMDMSLALDEENRIAGLSFKPHVAGAKGAAKKQDDCYTKIANHLIELINAADYSGVENLFNKEMSQALPEEKAKEFFAGLHEQVGKIQKLDKPKQKDGAMEFPVHCERGMLDMTLALDDENKIAGLYFKPRATASDAAPKKHLTQLSLPFKGKWLVFWGGDTLELNHHHDVPAQRFAFDILGVDEKGETHRGDGTRNEDYFCFGREILAPADGVVVEAIDGVHDNTPGSMNTYCLVGNCVVIEHRTNEFSVLAHFQRGSVVVKAGDHVQRGQLLGKCGNSGNSSEPHLHYHLQHSAVFEDALGIKCVFDKVQLVRDGTLKENYSPVKGDIISAD